MALTPPARRWQLYPPQIGRPHMPKGYRLAMQYDLVEFNTAIKPVAFRYVCEVLGANHVLYFDNDCYVTSSLGELTHRLARVSFVITPHIRAPIPLDGQQQTELNIMMAGTFNFGFLGVSATDEGMQFLLWWEERLSYFAYVDLANGMHYDQKWGDLIPSYFDQRHIDIIRDPECRERERSTRAQFSA